MTRQVEDNGRRDEDESVVTTVFRLVVWTLLQILAEIVGFYRDGC